MDSRFARNIPALSEKEQALLAGSGILVAGCGGIGGRVCELLLRAGVGRISLSDGDVFSESNFNRQAYCGRDSYGLNKAEYLAKMLKVTSPDTEIRSFPVFLGDQTFPEASEGCSVVIDAVDSVRSRLFLEDACARAGIVLVHGAVHGWSVQVGIIPPGSGILRRLYQNASEDASPEGRTVLSPAPSLCASVQTAEAIKLLTGRTPSLLEKLLVADLSSMEMRIFTL